MLAGSVPEFTSLLLPLAKVDGVFAEALRPFRFRIPRSPECLICGAASPAPRGRTSMWRWIRHWRDWAMNEIVTPRRLAGQPQAIYFRFEKGGLTLDNQPVPWSAEAVVVEALLRLPPTARRRGDFTLRVPGFDPVPAEILKADDAGQRHRLYFRFPVPKATGTAELMWRTHALGRLQIPVVTPGAVSDRTADAPADRIRLRQRPERGRPDVRHHSAAGTTASAVIQSPTGLGPAARPRSVGHIPHRTRDQDGRHAGPADGHAASRARRPRDGVAAAAAAQGRRVDGDLDLPRPGTGDDATAGHHPAGVPRLAPGCATPGSAS